MVLDQKSPAAHNSMLGFLIRKPNSSKESERPPKRQRITDPINDTKPPGTSPREAKKYIALQISHESDEVVEKASEVDKPTSDVDGEEKITDDVKPKSHVRATDLESTMPMIVDEDGALEEYEAFRASQEDRRDGNSIVPGSRKTAEVNSADDGNGEATGKEENKWIRGRSSIYVDAFNLALGTVLEEEAHLFDERERRVFSDWKELSYGAQYLYVRLFLRKTAAWHRISGLGYNGDISDLKGAIKELQSNRPLPDASSEPENHIPYSEPLEDDASLESSFTFADTSVGAITSLEEASSLLKLGELKTFAKEAKVQGKNKADLLKALRRTSKRQSGLGWTGLKRSDTESSAGEGRDDASDAGSIIATDDNSSEVADGLGVNRDAHFVRQMLAETGPCIRLSLPVLKLFERVHLVFYRSTEWTEKSLTTIILARISRWTFPSYVVSRSANVFPSRAALREFEASLRAQNKVDNILEFSGRPTVEGYDTILEIFEAVLPRWRVLLCEEQIRENSIYLSGEGGYLRRLSPAWVYTRIIHKATAILGKRKLFYREHSILSELLDQDLFHTSRRGAWYIRKALLEEHYMAKETLEHEADKDGNKGGDRQTTPAQIRKWKQTSLQTCETGLQDPLVHLIYHHDLQKRIIKLERALCTPRRQQHSFAHVRLAKATDNTVCGIRLEVLPATSTTTTSSSTSQPPPPPRLRRSRSSTKNTTSSTRDSNSSNNNNNNTACHPPVRTTLPSTNSSRTTWLDPRDARTPVTVEELALVHYRQRGWSGFHSESGILRTLFALLLYDEIFTYIPHVFQTAFQSAPLDLLHSDSFYAARRPLIEAALADVANGGGPARIRKCWEEQGPPSGRKTCVLGLDWNSFTLEQLVQIAGCAGGEALAVACKVLAQEYAQRAGGVPDLMLWRVGDGTDGNRRNENGDGKGGNEAEQEGEIRFVEVKSENDRLSDTQRLWIDVLTGAGVKVELCHVVAEEVRVLE